MSQVQVQIQAVEKPQVVFHIFTWGSCRRGYLEILHPKRIDLARWTGREGVHEVEIPGICKIRYSNADSRKNLHRSVEILDVYTTIVIRNYGRVSCSHGFEEVCVVTKKGDKLVYEKPEVKTEVAIEERGKHRVTVEKRYVEVNGTKVYIDDVEIERELCMEKLKVTLKKIGDRVVASGDTYHVRDVLKKHKMMWDPNNKVWHVAIWSTDINALVQELEQLGVQVEVL